MHIWNRRWQYDGQAAAEFSMMCAKQARSVEELKTMMLELEEKKKKMEQITGEETDTAHANSILAGVLDPETRKHTVGQQGVEGSYEDLRKKV